MSSPWYSPTRAQDKMLTLSVLSNRVAGSKVINVPKDFSEIQAAFDAANSGDCVCLTAGEYVVTMPLRLKKDIHVIGLEDGTGGVKVIMDNGHIPILTPDQQYYTKYDSHLLMVDTPTSVRISNIAFQFVDSKRSRKKNTSPLAELIFCLFIRAGNVLVDQCNFQCSFASCIGVSPESLVTVVNSKFFPTKEYGVFICRETRGFRCSKCSFEGCGTGIFMDELSSGMIEQGTFTNCEIAIELTAGSNAVIRKNIIEHSADKGIYCSSGLQQPTTIDIVGLDVIDGIGSGEFGSGPLGGFSIVSNNITDSTIGIHIQNFACARISKNLITGSSVCGVRLSDHGTGCVMFNEIYENQLGIEVVGEPSPTAVIAKNSVHSNKQVAIQVSDRNTVCIIRDNDIYNNELAGISFEEGSVGSVLSNRVYENHNLGISVSSGSAVEICENIVRDNAGSGISLKDCLPSSISRNCIEGNKGDAGLELLNLHRLITSGPSAAAPAATNSSAPPTSPSKEALVGGGLTGVKNTTLVIENKIWSNLKSGVDIRDCSIPGDKFGSSAEECGESEEPSSDKTGGTVSAAVPSAGLAPLDIPVKPSAILVSVELQKNDVRLNDGGGVWVREGTRIRLMDNQITQNVHEDLCISNNSEAIIISAYEVTPLKLM